MKTIKIAHLYYDLMNLYGENGNTRALEKFLTASGVKCEIHFLTIDDNIDFSKYDFYYMGMGSEENQLLVLNDIKKYASSIKRVIDKNKFFLMTGNSIELFGKYIEKLDGEKIECLNIFYYYTKETDFRIVGEQIYTTELISKPVIGFGNRIGAIKDAEFNLFDVKSGTGYEPNSTKEGIKYSNFYGTYLLGPLLIRNPYFTDYIVKQLLESNNIEYNSYTDGIEYTAYNEFLKNFIN